MESSRHTSSNSSRFAPAIMQTETVGIFTVFEKLPAELQLKIWEIAARVPQIIYVAQGQPLSYDVYNPPVDDMLVSKGGYPSTFYACRTSRNEAMKVRTLMFGDWFRHPIYFNPTSDIVVDNERLDLSNTRRYKENGEQSIASVAEHESLQTLAIRLYPTRRYGVSLRIGSEHHVMLTAYKIRGPFENSWCELYRDLKEITVLGTEDLVERKAVADVFRRVDPTPSEEDAFLNHYAKALQAILNSIGGIRWKNVPIVSTCNGLQELESRIF